MPHIVVYNLTPKDRKHVDQIEKKVNAAILEINELGLTEEDISYSFVVDDTVTSEEIPIIIIVELLFDKPERTDKVRQRLAEDIGNALDFALGQWRKTLPLKMEVAVKHFNPKHDGFWALNQPSPN